MESLLIFLAIIAIQMIAAYFAKQKKEAAKNPLPSWQQPTEHTPSPFKEIRIAVNHPPKKEPELDEAPVEIKKKEPVIKEEKPILNDHPADVHQRVSSALVSQLNLKNPAQGILWAAILHEPRYKVRWKRR